MHFEFVFFFKASYWAVFRFFGKPKIYIFCQLSEETPKERNSSSCFVFHWAGMRRQNCAICCAAKTSKTLLHKSLYGKSICIKSTISVNYSYNALNFQKVKYKQYIFGKSILPAFFWEEVRRPIMKFLPRQVVLYLYYLYYSGTAAALPLAVRHNKKGGGDEDALIATNLDDNVWKGNEEEEDKACSVSRWCSRGCNLTWQGNWSQSGPGSGHKIRSQILWPISAAASHRREFHKSNCSTQDWSP